MEQRHLIRISIAGFSQLATPQSVLAPERSVLQTIDTGHAVLRQAVRHPRLHDAPHLAVFGSRRTHCAPVGLDICLFLRRQYRSWQRRQHNRRICRVEIGRCRYIVALEQLQEIVV